MTEAQVELLWEDLEGVVSHLADIRDGVLPQGPDGTDTSLLALCRDVERMAKQLRAQQRCALDAQTELTWDDLLHASLGLEWRGGPLRRVRIDDIEHAAKELRRRYRA